MTYKKKNGFGVIQLLIKEFFIIEINNSSLRMGNFCIQDHLLSLLQEPTRVFLGASIRQLQRAETAYGSSSHSNTVQKFV